MTKILPGSRHASAPDSVVIIAKKRVFFKGGPAPKTPKEIGDKIRFEREMLGYPRQLSTICCEIAKNYPPKEKEKRHVAGKNRIFLCYFAI